MSTISPVINLQGALDRMGDMEIYLEIAEIFAENIPNALRVIEERMAENDLKEVTRIIHSLKGSCATVGAESLAAVCSALEKTCTEGNLSAIQAGYASLKPLLEALPGALRAIK